MADTEEEWFRNYCAEMEDDFGRGWKRRLAEKVGVSETNVQTWLKSGRVTPAVKTAILLSDEVEQLRSRAAADEGLRGARWIEREAVRGHEIFSVHERDASTGLATTLASNISSVAIARELANLPQIRQAIASASIALQLEDHFDHPADRAYVHAIVAPSWDGPTVHEREAERGRALSELISAFASISTNGDR